MDALRAALVNALRAHPRVLQQGLGGSKEARDRLYASLPPLVPFGGRRVHAVVAILDWDHRLPSRQLMLRVHLLYDPDAAERFELVYAEREEEIRQRNVYPEFDVADFEDLPSDESYEAELRPDLVLESMRLVSSWRREVEREAARAAVEAVRESNAFARVRAAEPLRPAHLGELEPVSWMPPCESGHDAWTIDVWWLTAFDGRIGRGWSFLVDVEAAEPVVTHREFTVRAG